jgi:hypothetical protein
MDWSGVLLNAVVQAMLLGALAFLARSVIVHWLGKDLEVFKAGLSSNAQRTLEQFKAELAISAREHQVRFESLHAKRVEAMEAVYGKLVAARYTMESFVLAWHSGGSEGIKPPWEEFRDLRREFDQKRIYLPVPLCEELSRCIAVMWSPAVAAHVWPGTTNPEYAQKASAAFMEAQTAIQDGGAVPIAIAKLEAEFRKALGDAG